MEKKKYTPGQAVEDALSALEEHKGKKPGAYESQWQGALNDLLAGIQGRKPFAYDPNRDALYRAAVDQHVRLGRKAMMDTMGKAAAMTGGYGNSYAQSVGQQTYGEYLQALAARLPQFGELALKTYQAQGQDLLDRYETLSAREKEAYGRYQQILNQYFSQQDRLQGAYDREKQQDYDRYVDNRNYEYTQEQDRLSAAAREEQARKDQERWEQDREYQAQRDKIEDEQWEREFQENKRRYEQAWAATHSGGGGGGGGSRGSGSYNNFSRYQSKHSMTEKEYAADKKTHAAGPYKPRPAGRPWSPSHSHPRRPNYKITLN